jgi:predicted RND superfamily exporter protein
MPTETDVKLAEDLADFRVEVERRFGALETTVAGFRSGVETELRIIRKLGTWILGAALGIVAAMVTGAATVAWSASAVVADVKHQGERIDKLEGRMERVEKRLDGMDAKLDTLISRTAPTPKAGG